MKYYIESIKKYVITFLQVQFLLTLVSLPILAAWGLPISLMTAVGNCIFNPFVTAFLFCSSLIFFTEIFHIPNTYLITILDWIASSWMYFLSFGTTDWLIGFPTIMLPLLCITALIALVTLQHIKFGKSTTYIFVSLSIIIGLIIIRTYLPKPNEFEITCKKKKVIIQNHNGTLHLIDKGGLGENKNNNSWINYTLLPAILKEFGSQSIETITTNSETEKTKNAIQLLHKECNIKKQSFL